MEQLLLAVAQAQPAAEGSGPSLGGAQQGSKGPAAGPCVCIVLGEVAAADDAVMELLQLLLLSPAQAVHLLAAAEVAEVQREYQRHLQSMLMGAVAEVEPQSGVPNSGGKRTAAAQGLPAQPAVPVPGGGQHHHRSSPRAVAVAVDSLRRLMSVR